MKRRLLLGVVCGVLLVIGLGCVLPEAVVMPVVGATASDWHPESFWYHPWGRSVVHRGIDVFADEGTPVVSATPGVVLACGQGRRGGNLVLIAGPRWRLHYYAHLKDIRTTRGARVAPGTVIGSVGATGNAVGTPPHLHYAILSLLPRPWKVNGEPLGLLKAFYVDPGRFLTTRVDEQDSGA
jgi:murein DD-endopeptidase MepM/ murein hydrolase activator NlpD